MKRQSWLMLAVVAAATGTMQGRAHACNSGVGGSWGGGAAALAIGIVAGGAALAVTDLSLGVYDIAKAAQGERPSSGVAVTEVALGIPQVALGGVVVANATGTARWWALGITAVPAALTVHGLWALTTRPSTAEPAEFASRRVTIAPTMLGDDKNMMPGLVAAGRF
jgi:hypothetical protein